MSRTEISAARDLIAGIQKQDPRLYNALLLMADSIEGLTDLLEPLIRKSEASSAVPGIPLAPIDFRYVLYPTVVELSWTGLPDSSDYEVREGAAWDTADFVARTTSQEMVLEPLSTGSHTFLVKARNVLGQESTTFASVTVVIPVISAVTITTQVIDNNVLLYWTKPTSTFAIDHYDIYRQGVLFGEARSTFFTLFETVAGNYTYRVVAVDIAGNEGNTADVTIYVNTPPDFELQAFQTSLLTGTLVNCLLRDGKLLACYAAHSWQSHFTSRGWLDPSDQWDAGWHKYIEPTSDAGSYVETFDFGSVFNNTIVNVEWAYRNIGSIPLNVGCSMEASDDGLAWTAPQNGKSVFFSHLRYVRVTLAFTGTDGHSLAEIWNIRVALDVKQEVDSGRIEALSIDDDGTEVLFTKSFKDVNSITLTCDSLEPLEAIYSFVDVPNPTGFKVMVFDSAGSRVNAFVSWKARGIV